MADSDPDEAPSAPMNMSAETFNQLAIEQLIPRAHQMGIRMVELRRGYARAQVPMDGNGNHLGTMYAGTLFAIAEVLGGAIFTSSFDRTRFYPVVKDLKIRFRHPARDTVTASASMDDAQIAELDSEANAAGKAEFVLDAQLFDEAGELVAEAQGTYQIRAHGR
jgi:thioesterase domain-containing protein